MRWIACVAGALSMTACSKAPTAAAEAAAAPAVAANAAANPTLFASVTAPVTGLYTAGGQAAQLREVTAHKHDPFNGHPITELVFTSRPQDGDARAATDALFGHFGDAIIVQVEPDGRVVGADLVHHGLTKTNGNVSVAGAISILGYKAADGQITGRLTWAAPPICLASRSTSTSPFTPRRRSEAPSGASRERTLGDVTNAAPRAS